MVLTETFGQITADGSLQELFSVGDGIAVKHYATKIFPNQLLEGDEARIVAYTWDNQADILKEYMTKKLKYSEWRSKILFKEKDILANLIARWQFNDAITDSVGKNDLTLGAGTTTYSTDKKEGSKSHDFDGLTYYTAPEANFDFERTDKWSVSFWVKYTNVATNQLLVAKANGFAQGWMIFLNTFGDIEFRLINTVTTNDLEVRTDSTLNLGVWHYITVTYGGTSAPAGVKIYIDGISQTLITITNNLSASILNNVLVALGAASDGTLKFTGKLDDVRIYNAEITASQATQIYKKAVSERLLELWLKLDNTPNDSSGNGNNGTWTGTARYDVGIISRAARFLGAEYITLANESNFDFERTQPFSVAFWMRVCDIPSM